jgi:hypothetical protein
VPGVLNRIIHEQQWRTYDLHPHVPDALMLQLICFKEKANGNSAHSGARSIVHALPNPC